MVGSGELRALEQGHQPGERRAQLVRDRRSEARPQLLVGGEIAWGAQVDERLAAAVELVGDLVRRPPADVEQLIREHRALDEAVERLAGAPARRERRRLASSSTTTISRLSSIRICARSRSARVESALGCGAGARRNRFTRLSPDRHRVCSGARSIVGAMPRVLIVEDDEVIADGIARHLEAGGFDAVRVAARRDRSGAPALRAAGRRASST